jgi:hypothetical protein
VRDQIDWTILAAVAGCQWLSPVQDRPEVPLDHPAAISPGNEYHLQGATLTITNVELEAAGAGGSATFHVAEGDRTSAVHLEASSDRTGWGGYFFVLQSIDLEKQRAVIVIEHTTK